MYCQAEYSNEPLPHRPHSLARLLAHCLLFPFSSGLLLLTPSTVLVLQEAPFLLCQPKLCWAYVLCWWVGDAKAAISSGI